MWILVDFGYLSVHLHELKVSIDVATLVTSPSPFAWHPLRLTTLRALLEAPPTHGQCVCVCVCVCVCIYVCTCACVCM
jgi:hypothetical protein